MGGKKNYFGGQHRDMIMFDPETLKIRHDPQRPNEIPIDENMVASIMARGVLEPLIIYIDGQQPTVDAGRRRQAHAVEANKRLVKAGLPPIKVPCIVKRGDEIDLLEISVIENEHREQPSPISRARTMQVLFDKGRTEKELAVTFNCTVQSVKDNLKLLDCAKPVRDWVEKGGSASIARELADLPQDQQGPKLEEMIKVGAATGARGLEAAKQVRRGETASPTKSRMLSRIKLEEIAKRLTKIGKHGEVAYAVIRRVLGHERAFANYPQLKEAFDGEDKS